MKIIPVLGRVSRMMETLTTACTKPMLYLRWMDFCQKSCQVESLIIAVVTSMTEWFEVNYVHEQIRRRLWNGVMVRPPPPFAPSLWSVFECMESGFPRTRNNIEAWHRRWKSLLGKVHVGVYQIVEEFRKAQRHVTKEDERLLRGEPCPQGKKEDIRHEERRQNVIRNREGRLNRMDYLRAIAQNSHM
ncbi:hypothetical protein M513_10652 [Trichuris suis]|uniref:MULE transposase domain-containing protein n=1 Tax=Trichuris suis TaxID=68888 RepID=A0A085LTY8_9BILA|nr:hypothetical protein M513_10652 [Trichuris suis]